jgi:hypothetical protein
LTTLRESVEQGSASNKTLFDRILTAKRTAGNLSSAMEKIKDAYVRFLVRVPP